MGTVLEDVTSDNLDAEYVRRRVDDWEQRLDALFASIRGWLPDGWEVRQGDPVVMDEPLMREFGIAAKQMPTLELRDDAGHVTRVVPRGLWIIGTNGQAVLRRDGRRYRIADKSESFETPDWQATPPDQWRVREPVNEDWLKRVLQ